MLMKTNNTAEVADELNILRQLTAKNWVAQATPEMIAEIRSGTTSWSPDMIQAIENEIQPGLGYVQPDYNPDDDLPF